MHYLLVLCINRAPEYSINNSNSGMYQSPTATKMSSNRNRQQQHGATTDTSTIDAYPLDTSNNSNVSHSRRRSSADNNISNNTSKSHRSQYSNSGTGNSRRNSDRVTTGNNHDGYADEYGISNDANTRKQQQQQQQQGSAMFVKAVRPCSYCHVPYNNRLAPFANMRLVPCGVCGRKWVAQTVSC
jgi:hypothetical protein